MKTIIMGIVCLTAAASAAYASEGAAVPAKPMTRGEFMAAPEQRGLDKRMAEKKYDMYRTSLGSVPTPDLGKKNLRSQSDEVRGRY